VISGHPGIVGQGQELTRAAQQDAHADCRPASFSRINIVYLFKLARASMLTSAIGSPRHRRLRECPLRSRLFAQWPLRIGSLARPPLVQTSLAAPGL
jgi:hypothetical protein